MLAPIIRRANQLRRALRLSVSAVGVSWALFGVFAFFVVSYGLDFFLPEHLDLFQRALLLLLALGGIGFLVVRFTLLPLGGRYSVDSLVLAIEKVYPQLNDRLISSLQLDRQLNAGDTSMSHMMAKLVIDDGIARAGEINPIAPINRGRVNWFSGGGLACVVLLTAAFAMPPMHMGIWFSRNVLLKGDQYPQRTRLSLYWNLGGGVWTKTQEGGTIAVPRGENLYIEVRADTKKDVPPRAYLRYEFEGSDGELAKSPIGAGSNAHRFRFSFLKLSLPMRLTIRGGDYQPVEGKNWWQVRVLEPPTISSLRLECTFPPYTGMPDKVFGIKQLGNLKMPVGTKIKLTAKTTKPIIQARVVSLTREDVVGGRMGESLLDWPEDAPVTEFSEELVLIKGGELFIELLDHENVRNQLAVQFKITAVPDEAPSVSVGVRGVSHMVTPRATVPVVAAVDDDHGTRAMTISADSGSRKKPYEIVEVKQLTDKQGRTVNFGPRKVKGVYRWDITLLDTKPGDFLTFKVMATDNEVLMPNPVPPDMPAGGGEPKARLPILDGANIGESEVISLKIVDENTLMEKVLADQIELGIEFNSLFQQQMEFRVTTKTIRAEFAKQGALTAQQLTVLKDLRQGQGKIPEELVRIADRLLAIAEEIENNRINVPDELRILREALAAPTRALAATFPVDAAKGLREAGAVEDTAPRDAVFARVIIQQNLAIAEMEDIDRRFKKIETMGQIRRFLIQIIGDQKLVEEIIRKKYRVYLDELLGPGTGPEPRIE